MAKNPFKASDAEREFFQLAIQSKPVEEKKQENLKEKEERSFGEDISNNFLSANNALTKGLIRGLTRTAQGFGFIQPQMQEDPEAVEKFLSSLDQQFPTEEGLTSAVLEKGVEAFVPSLTSPFPTNLGEMALRSLIGSGGSELARQQDLPEPVQRGIEIAAFATPKDLGRKTLQPKESQKKLVDFARKVGLKEEQIAPLIQEEGKMAFLSKFSPKGGRTRKILDKVREGKNQVFSYLETKPEASQTMSTQVRTDLRNSINQKLGKMSSELTKKIEKDLEVFEKSEGTLSDAVDLTRKINDQFKGSGRRFQTLKEPITEAIRKTNPDFAQDFELTNEIYKRFLKVNNLMKPSLASHVLDTIHAAKAPVQLAYGLSTGNPWLITEVVGETAGRQLSRELLLNPRFQNIGRKFVTAIKNSSPNLASGAIREMTEELTKANADQQIIDELNAVDLEEFFEKLKTIPE